MSDIIQKWIQRKIALEEQLNSLKSETIMDDEDAVQYDVSEKQLSLIKEIVNDLQHQHYVWLCKRIPCIPR